MLDYIHDALDKLEQYPDDWITFFAIGYQTLKYGNQNDIVRLGRMGSYYLTDMTITKQIKVGEQFGSYTSLLWSIDWKDVDIPSMSRYFQNPKDYMSLVMMGSFHPSGYFREKCLKILEKYPHTLSLMMLRMNDWVEEVQDEAYRCTYHRIQESLLPELIQAAYVFMKVKKSQRRSQKRWDEIETCYYESLKSQIGDFDIADFLKQNIHIRKSFYKVAIEKRLLSYEILEQLMVEEKDTFCLLVIIRNLLQDVNDPVFVQSFFVHHSFYMRREAYIRYYEIVQDAWNGIENALLDKSYSIRDYIRFIMRKHRQFDILDFYLHHLDCPEAIHGVGECGNADHIDIILPYLECSDTRFVKAALSSLNRLITYHGADIYWRYVLDRRASVSKSAYLAILKNKVHYGADYVYQHYQVAQEDHIKRYLLLLLLEEDSWERLPYLLKMYWYPEMSIQRRIQMKVNQRNPYKKVSQELKQSIISCLSCADYAIPADVVESIMFDLKFVS